MGAYTTMDIRDVGIVGASGYSGIELTRLVLGHGGVRLAFATSDRWEGQQVVDRTGLASHLRYVGVDQVGIRATWGSPEDGDLVKGHGGRMYLPEDVVERGPKAIARQILEQVGDRPAYISFDVDAIEPADAPGTGTPVPGGITAREALWILQGLKGLNLVGMDVVEVCPALDVNTRTSQLAAHLIYEGLALAGIRAG